MLWLCRQMCSLYVGVALTRSLVRSVLTDYSYVNINISTGVKNTFLTRCFTGLGPIGNNNNSILGELYFNGNRIPNGKGCSSQGIIQAEPGSRIAGVINMYQCREFSTMAEGVYTYIILNSSAMYESIKVGLYFSGRSESLNLYISSLNHLLCHFTQLFQ